MTSKRKQYPGPRAESGSVSPDPNTSHGLMIEMVGRGKRVLEFGCARGEMSRFLALEGCNVTGIEIDPGAAEEARKNCNEVIVADLDARHLVDLLPASSFDVAVFGDILEHLRDPWQVLEETRTFLGPGAYVVMSIPNIAHGAVRLALLRGAFNYQELGLLDDTHLRFFTAKTVRELCLRAGFRIDRMERTKVDIFDPTNLIPRLNPSDFDPALIDSVRSDPEHDTLQFVIKASPLDDAQRTALLIQKVLESEDHVQEARSETGRLAAENDRLKAATQTLSEQLEQRSAEVEETRATAHSREDALESARHELQARTAELQVLRDQLSADAGLRESLQAETEALTLRVTDLQAVAAELLELRETLAVAIRQRDEDAAQHALEKRAEDAGREALEAELTESRHLVESSELRLADLGQQNEGLRAAVRSREDVLEEARHELQARTAELLELRETLAVALRQRDEDAAQRALEKQAEDACREALEAELTESRHLVESSELRLADLGQQNEGLRAAVRSREDVLEEARHELQARTAELLELRETLAVALRQRDEDAAQRALEKQAEDACREALEAELTESRHLVESSELRLADLGQQNEGLRAAVRSREDVLEEARHELQARTAELLELRETLAVALRQRDEDAAQRALEKQAEDACREALEAELTESRHLVESSELKLADLGQQNEELRELLRMADFELVEQKETLDCERALSDRLVEVLQKEASDLWELVAELETESRRLAESSELKLTDVGRQNEELRRALAAATSEVERELAAIRGETATVGHMIQEIYHSPWWSLKLGFNRMAKAIRLPRLRQRV